ncbi:hypothetical protein P3X46_030567 [Hevea brasiliensis]|uniref:Uncharacterized protein n=1 Tax=Hevea brasiliensis TaxID=3981 RepID=A0ABQ9KHP8_HEVBR|nr:hypothetical protein P3X46_030567 [Hevea brasiliensis]
MNNEEGSVELELDSGSREIWEEFTPITRLANHAKSKVNEFKEKKKNEIRELENSEVALLEKESVEKSRNKLKGNTEQRGVALLQIAERGLQRVGFGFMMGSGSTEQSVESSGASTTATPASTTATPASTTASASTVERIMKNLRLVITQLRRLLGVSRSDIERLQSLTEKQIKELEERERVLGQNVEELLMEIKETETEVDRRREACELEVEAGKKELEECDKVVVILKQELERRKAALEISNGKLELKKELATAAMTAEAAAEKSLQLAGNGLRRQLEVAENRAHSCRKVGHICWP